MDPIAELNELTGEVAALGSHLFRVRVPFVRELRRYSWPKFRSDLVAGATLTLVSIPQAIGFSLILNLPPTPVIASLMIGGFVGSLFFSSRHHVFGPTSSISLIVAATVAEYTHATGLEPLQLAVYLAFMIGVIQLMAGLLNFGEITKFISRSVVVGYSTAIGVLLIASQIHNVLGYATDIQVSFVRNMGGVFDHVFTGRVDLWAIGIGVATLGIFLLLQRLRPKWPEALIGLALLGIAARVYTLHNPHPPFLMVKDEGALTAVIPAFAGFQFAPNGVHRLVPELAGTAVAIAILGMLEAAAITKGLAARSGQKIEPNQELIGMGAANMACALFGAVPGSSSFARSAVNYQSGAASQLSSMMSSLVVLVVLLFVTPIFNYIPVAALAAHLIRIGVKMINRHQVRVACRSTRADAIVFLVTLLSALLLKLDTAIYVGIGVALALFLQQTST
ncbi:MAG: SulP family inorganic anion transporter, partial [Opitutaceae bacterium]